MKKLVLIGGGHSHAIALREWGKKKITGIKVILISNVKKTPYSGMLPGLIAGYYDYETTHIDLEKLTKFTEVQLKCLLQQACQDLKKWQEIVQNCQSQPDSPLTINIIGGGAGGVELALNMHHRLTNILKPEILTINLIHRGARILSHQNKWVSHQLTQILNQRKINLYLRTEIKAVTATEVITKSGKKITSDYSFLVTQAQAPLWLQNNQIITDENGFILVQDSLQTINYDNIFATGDIATMINYPRPKAGVFAVKQGKPLLQNICKYLSNKPLKKYKPQQKYLNIIGTGNKKAIAIWGPIACQSPLLWNFKEWLDFNFMNQFNF